jgi:hypothetical protein
MHLQRKKSLTITISPEHSKAYTKCSKNSLRIRIKRNNKSFSIDGLPVVKPAAKPAETELAHANPAAKEEASTNWFGKIVPEATSKKRWIITRH